MQEGRDWWVGVLEEPVPDFPNETHCLHLKTPLKEVVFLCNRGDFEQLMALSNAVINFSNSSWLERVTAAAKRRVKRLEPLDLDALNEEYGSEPDL